MIAPQPTADSLVAADGSRVDRRVITDPGIFEQELEQVFRRTWAVVAHESQVREAGSFVASWIGDDPVVVSRGRDGAIHVVLNSCSHRASRVCRVDAGTTSTFTCDNHGWTYGLDGRLLGIPHRAQGYAGAASDGPAAGLVAATVDSYCGLVFATFDEDPPTLAEHLGDATYYLETIFGRYEHGSEVLDGTMKALVGCNWKIAMENLGTDLQHPEIAHGSFMDIWPDPVMEFMDGSEQILTSNLNPVCIGRRPPPYTEAELVLRGLTDAAERREVEDWYRTSNQYAVDHLGKTRAELYAFTGSVFPNLSFLPGVSAVFLLFPRGPAQTEWWSWCLVPSDAPPAVRALRRQIFMMTAGPGGIILAEDSENWSDMTRAPSGQLGTRIPLRVDRGMGEEYQDDEMPGTFAPMRTEHVQRGFWRNWRRAMDRPR